jgi:hypothetical protein
MSGTSAHALKAFENEGRLVNPIDRTCPSAHIDAVRSALENAGVEFLRDEAGAPIVRLRKAEV